MNLPKMAAFRSILWIGVVLLPWMSLPVLPADYRPVSVLAFAVTGLALLVSRAVRGSLPRDEAVLLAFGGVCALQSLVLVGILHHEYARSLRHLAVLALGILSYISLKEFFRIYGVPYALRLMGWVYLFILTVGVIEVLCILHVLPWEIKAFLGQVFGGRVVGRVQLVTSEASWAAKVLLFGLPILGFLAGREKSWLYRAALLLALLLLVFTLSLEGLIAAAIAVILFAVFQVRALVTKPKLILAGGLVLAGLVGLFYLSYRVFPQNGQYYMSRFATLGSLDGAKIRQIPRNDASAFIRIYYPLFGVQMFLDRPWGVGLGGYSLYFKPYLDQTGIDYRRFPEVMGDLRTRTGDPRSLYAKILAENGLISGGLLVWFFLIHLCHLKQLPRDGIISYRNLVIALLAVTLAILFQFGSYAYLPMWFTLALNAEACPVGPSVET